MDVILKLTSQSFILWSQKYLRKWTKNGKGKRSIVIILFSGLGGPQILVRPWVAQVEINMFSNSILVFWVNSGLHIGQNLEYDHRKCWDLLGAFESFSQDEFCNLLDFLSMPYWSGYNKTKFLLSADQKYLQLSGEIYQTTDSWLIVETW